MYVHLRAAVDRMPYREVLSAYLYLQLYVQDTDEKPHIFTRIVTFSPFPKSCNTKEANVESKSIRWQ